MCIWHIQNGPTEGKSCTALRDKNIYIKKYNLKMWTSYATKNFYSQKRNIYLALSTTYAFRIILIWSSVPFQSCCARHRSPLDGAWSTPSSRMNESMQALFQTCKSITKQRRKNKQKNKVGCLLSIRDLCCLKMNQTWEIFFFQTAQIMYRAVILCGC